MKKAACTLLVLALAACGGSGGDEAAETADTPSIRAADTTGARDTTQPCDTCPPAMVRDTAQPCDTCRTN
jgi:hypothetical protein